MARNLSQWTTRIPISGSKFNYSLDHGLPGIQINIRNVILIEWLVDGPEDAMNGRCFKEVTRDVESYAFAHSAERFM